MTALERMELIIPARSGLNPMLAVLQGKAARVLLACTRRLVLSEFLLYPTGRRVVFVFQTASFNNGFEAQKFLKGLLDL